MTVRTSTPGESVWLDELVLRECECWATPLIKSHVARLLRSTFEREEAEQLVRIVLAQRWTKHQTYDEFLRRYVLTVSLEALKSSLAIICRYVCSNLRRSARRFSGRLDPLRDQLIPGAARWADHTGLGEQDALRILRTLTSALNVLPPRSRQLAAMYFIEGRSYREIAAAVAVTEKAVRERISRVGRLLSAEVERLADE